MVATKLITGPAVQPLTLAETKAHLRVTHTDEDALIQSYIEAATSWAQVFLGRALVTQTWQQAIDAFPTDGFKEIKVALPPLQSVTSIKYDDANRNEQTVAGSSYVVDLIAEPGRIMPLSAGWPIAYNGLSSVRIQFVAGYPATTDSPPNLAGNVPGGIKQGLLLLIGSMYENREDQVAGLNLMRLPVGAEALLRQFRVAVPIA